MKFELKEATMYLFPEDRIDTSNIEVIEAEIHEICNSNSFSKIVFDFESVVYISSSGLRVILKLLKEYKNIEVINANSEVYEIFEVTGFSEMIPVSKAYRKLDLSGCEILGEGSNGIVYRYTDDIIVKVYRNNDALKDIHRERDLAKAALVMGVNTAIPYDVVKVGDHYGSVFELINSKSITKLIKQEPENTEMYIKIFVDFLKEIHRIEVTSDLLPSIKDVYLGYAQFLKEYLDPRHYEKLIKLISDVPDSKNMIHGDYHTSNVHYANNECILIDMDTIATGSPVFEFAAVFLAYRGFNEITVGSSIKFFKMDSETAKGVFDMICRIYADGDEELENRINCAAAILGYTRLLRRTIRREPEKIDEIESLKNRLSELVDKMDSIVV